MPAVRSSPGAKKRLVKTCETCRARKVRCIRDGNSSCNECMERKLVCVYTEAQSSPVVSRPSPYQPRRKTLFESPHTGNLTVASRPSQNFEATKSSALGWRPALMIPGMGPLNVLRDTHMNGSDSPPDHRQRVFTAEDEQSAPPIAVGPPDAPESNTPSAIGPTYPVGTLPISEDEQSEPPVVVGTPEAPESNMPSDNGPIYRVGTAAVPITEDDQILLQRASKVRSCNEQIRDVDGQLSKDKSDEVKEFEKRYSIVKAEVAQQERHLERYKKEAQDVCEGLRNAVERDNDKRRKLKERRMELEKQNRILTKEMMEPFTLEHNAESTDAEASAGAAITT